MGVDQPGGGRSQQYDDRNVQKPPPAVREHQLAATSEGYRRQAQQDAILLRTAGLFPPGDPLLAALARLPGSWPFEKHLPGVGSPYQLLRSGGWVTGDSACASGLDLRLFYQPPAPGEQWATLQGAVRLGDGAAIGNGFYMGAHGGAIESVLDEATAELAKLVWKPMVSTVAANFQIKKPVPLHTSLRVVCRIKEQRGIRCWVAGSINHEETGTLLAEVEACLVDMTSWI